MPYGKYEFETEEYKKRALLYFQALWYHRTKAAEAAKIKALIEAPFAVKRKAVEEAQAASHEEIDELLSANEASYDRVFEIMSEGTREEQKLKLKDMLFEACEKFADAKTAKDASAFAGDIRAVLDRFEDDPELAASEGITMDILTMAEGAAEMGRIINRGMMAMDMLATRMIEEEEISEEDRLEDTAAIIAMELVLNQKHNLKSDMQRFLGASGVRVSETEKGKVPEAELKLMNDIQNSKGVAGLSKMTSADAGLILLDKDFRAGLTAGIADEIRQSILEDPKLGKEIEKDDEEIVPGKNL